MWGLKAWTTMTRLTQHHFKFGKKGIKANNVRIKKKKKKMVMDKESRRGKRTEEYYSMKQVPKVDARLSCLA